MGSTANSPQCCCLCGAPQSAWRSLDAAARTPKPGEDDLIDLSHDHGASSNTLLPPLSDPPDLRCLEGPMKTWTDWLSQVAFLDLELVTDFISLEVQLKEIVTVLFLCRRASCPLLLQESVLKIASICDDAGLAANRAVEPVCELIDLLSDTEDGSMHDAPRDKVLSSWPQVAYLDLDLLDSFCSNIDEYLATHVKPPPPHWSESACRDSSTDELAKSSEQFGVFIQLILLHKNRAHRHSRFD